jgi:hypothetical protein
MSTKSWLGMGNSWLEEIYFNPKTGYSGINYIVRKSGLKEKQVKEFLDAVDTHILYINLLGKSFQQEKCMLMV